MVSSRQNVRRGEPGALHRLLLAMESAYETGRGRLRRALPGTRPVRIQPHIGWANDRRAWVSGRVLANRLPELPDDEASVWRNLRDTWRRWRTVDVPDAEVRLEVAGTGYRTRTDEEGFYWFEVDLPGPLRNHEPWHEVTITAVSREGGRTETPVRGRLMVPPADAHYGVISDVDDTVLHSGITDLVTAVRLTFFQNARTRRPLAGVGALYRHLQRGTVSGGFNPVFYVSSSAWNLFDLLLGVLRVHGVPVGPILLRDLGLTRRYILKSGHEHKLDKAETILACYPELPFLLIGDSGQQDAALYTRLVERHPHRVRAVYIRDVDPDTASERDRWVEQHIEVCADHGVPMRLVRDSLEIAEHVVGLGYGTRRTVVAVERDQRQDRSRDLGAAESADVVARTKDLAGAALQKGRKMLRIDEDTAWALVATGAAVAGAMAARAVLRSGWRAAAGEDPPRNPASSSTGWAEALLWSAAAGAAIGMMRVVARRGAAAGWRAALGSSPPDV